MAQVAAKRIVSSVLAGLVAEAANKVIPLAIIFYAQWRLGVERFGFAQFGMTLIDLAVPLVGFGYQNLVAIEIGRLLGSTGHDREAIGRLVSDVLALKLLHALAALAVALVVVWFYPPYRPYAGIVLALGFLLFSSALDMISVHIGTQRMFSVSVLSTVAKVASLVGIVALVRDPEDAVMYAVLSVGANSVISVGTFVLTMRRYPLYAPRWSRLGEWFTKALPFAAVFMLVITSERFDMVLVERYMGSVGAGLYAAPWRVMQALMPVVMTIAAVFMSELVAVTDKESFTRHVRLGLWAVLAVILPMAGGVWFVERELLGLVSVEPTAQTGRVLSILVCNIAAHALLAVFGFQILMLRGKVRVLNWMLLVGTLVGIGLGVVLGPRFGLVGIACAPVAAKGLAGLLAVWVARPFLTAMPWSEIVRTVVPTGIMVGALALGGFNGLWINVGAAVAVYGAAMVIFNPQEVRWIATRVAARVRGAS